MRLNFRYSGGILLTCLGCKTFHLNASEENINAFAKTKVRPQIGEWRRWKEESESLGPFLKGIGAPAIAVFFVDAILIKNDLSIQLDEGNQLEVTDKTLLGSNVTKVQLGGEELEKSTRTGRKKFMLSAFESETDGNDRITVQCRLFQRGPGWYTQQSWIVDSDDILREQMVLKRDKDCDIVVNRAYKRLSGPNQTTGEDTSFNDANQNQYSNLSKAMLSLAGIGSVFVIGCFVNRWRSPSNND